MFVLVLPLLSPAPGLALCAGPGDASIASCSLCEKVGDKGGNEWIQKPFKNPLLLANLQAFKEIIQKVILQSLGIFGV